MLSLRIKFLKESFLVSRTDSQSFLTTNALILRKFEIELLNRFAFRTVSIEDRVGTKYTPRRFVGQGVIDDFHLHEAWLNVARSDCDGATMRLRERQWNLAAPLYILLHCLRVKTSRRRRVEIGQGKKCRGVPTRVRDTPSPLRPEPWEKTRFHKKKNKKSLFFYKSSRFCDKISRNPTEISAGSLFGESFESVSSDMRCDECNFLTKVRKRKERSWRNLVLSQTRFS